MIFQRLFLLSMMILSTGTLLLAQDDDFDESQEWSERSFVIVGTTENYDAAIEIASDASYHLDLLLDLRELSPDSTIGLTWSPEICEGTGWDHPCYVARGRFDNGVYISIEYSNAYEAFVEGYYIVVMASGMPNSSIVRESLQKAREFVEDAYIKNTKVYMGCMH